MSDMDGFELYDRMHKLDPNLKVIFVSGDHNHYQAGKLAHSEIDSKNFLNKPTSLAELLKRIKHILGTDEGSS